MESRTLLSATDLDTGFAAGGTYQLDTTAHASQGVSGQVVQSDGKIVTAGYIGSDGNESVVVRRFTTNGALDTTFGAAGSVLINTQTTYAQACDVAVGADGKIVLLAMADQQNFIARLLPNGTLDSTFGTAGVQNVASPTTPVAYTGQSVLVAPDGKIIYLTNAISYDLTYMARLNANGTPDTTFGSSGSVSYNSNGFDGRALVWGPSGNFYMGGAEFGGWIGVAEFNSSGTLVSSFGSGGLAYNTFAGGRPLKIADAISIQTDGKILLAGRTGDAAYDGTFDHAIVSRFNADGTVDTTFGAQGILIDSSSTMDIARSVTQLTTGQVAVGAQAVLDPRASRLLVLTSTGQLDTTFNSTGTVNPAMPGTGSGPRSVTVSASLGKPLITGIDANGDEALARYALNGTADSTFGTGRVTVAAASSGGDTGEQVLTLPDNSMLVAGWLAKDGFVLKHLSASGTVDTSFGTSGSVPLPYLPSAIALASNGKIYVGSAHFIYRFLSNGAVDSTWGTNGSATINSNLSLTSIAIDPRNGNVLIGTGMSAVVLRMTSTGALDTTFGNQGQFSDYPFYPDTVVAQADGKVVASGSFNLQDAVLRLNTDGTLDTTFNGSGIATAPGSLDANFVAIKPTGQIITAGSPGGYQWTVNCFTSAGALDPSFNGNGTQYIRNDAPVTAMSLENDGKIVLGGTYFGANSGLMVARVDADGSMDAGFGTAGTLNFGQATGWQYCNGMAVDTLGRIIVSGQLTAPQTGRDLAVARFQGNAATSASVDGTGNPDTFAISQDADHQHLDWSVGNTSGQILLGSGNSLTLNGNGGADMINLISTNGSALPATLHLNGTFTLNGFAGTNPLIGTTLEINASTLFITYSNPVADPISTLRGYLKNGFNGGLWNGAATATTGAIRSTDAGSSAHNTAIGYADSADGLVTLPANTLELKYTFYGDTGLTGSVGFTDFMRMTQHFTQSSGATWGNGDFNYDGAVNAADFALLQPNYGKTLAAPSLVPAVPPPSGRPSRSTTLPSPSGSLVGSTTATSTNLVNALTLNVSGSAASGPASTDSVHKTKSLKSAKSKPALATTVTKPKKKPGH